MDERERQATRRCRVGAGRNEVRATQDRVVAETEECRRLAELLNLDAVGVLRMEEGRRRVAWWAAPSAGPLPLYRDEVLEGRAEGWIACPRGADVVFAHLTPDSSVRSISTLRAMLFSLPHEEGDGRETELDDVAADDQLARDRMRWAYAIHDGLTQVVTAAVLDLEWLARRADVQPKDAIAALTEASTELRKALEEIRRMLTSLSPEEDEEEPLEHLVQGLTERWQIPASWSIEGDLHDVPRPVLEAASSVIRESVANAAKHSESSDVAVHVQASRTAMEIHVEDHGRGFEPSESGEAAGHLGLDMMRRRVAEVHGTIDIESAPGCGTRVVARLPVQHQGEKP
jgi:signal transduction histidine kinase